jgi:uncharacterized protein (DUF2336 family)
MGFLDFLKPAKIGKRLEADEKQIAHHGNERARLNLATDERTSQEILYYLALHDPSDKVRKKVAANPSTPMQASTLLAKDRSEDVRIVLARRLVRILPALSEEKYSQLYAFAVQSLGMLALDEVLKIRKALSETLKDHAHTPPSVAAQLARDLEREVSEPILRFCAALSDEDIIDILKTHPANWAAEAVARRKSLSAPVTRAVLDTGNVRAGKYLLENESAEISPDLLEMIVERAREYPEWHKPIAMRKTLPPLMAMKLAAYVDKTVRKILEERSDLDIKTIGEISAIVQRRMDFEDRRRKTIDRSNPVERAQKMFASGDLSEEAVADALAMRDKEFVIAALALRARVTMGDIEKIFDVQAPKTICALTWKCGYSMRLALKLQQVLAGIKPALLIYPRGGTDYPLTEEQMRWQLGMIGLD